MLVLPVTGWMVVLTFEDAPFADIAHRLERKFQVKISLERNV